MGSMGEEGTITKQNKKKKEKTAPPGNDVKNQRI
jgi:hypothetical protein